MSKTKSIIRKIIYGILFLIMILAFIYLGEKYADNSKTKTLTINDYYSEIKSEKFEVVYGSKMINLLKEGTNIIFIGSKNSEYSKRYIQELNIILEQLNIEKIYYYDIVYDKSQKNSNYYEIRELLKGSLTTTDGSKNNLLAPSLYIIDNGEVKYYNTETVAMKNTDTVENYWTTDQQIKFSSEITLAINNYYLNFFHFIVWK